MAEPLHLFGIRHHGPGCARSLQAALDDLQPDAVLVEGPPDADSLIPLTVEADMVPPVAVLVYAKDTPRRAAFYPFAPFSPEWQALQYGVRAGVAVQFMDLPQCHQLAMDLSDETAEETKHVLEDDVPEDDNTDIARTDVDPLNDISRDPIGALALADGYNDGERWWEQMIESRLDGTPIFEAIEVAMTALRAEVPVKSGPAADREAMREAWMRKTIRKAQKAGCKRIAVVCGAWHVPALRNFPSAASDNARLKKMPKIKVAATVAPWTYGRMTQAAGYGAGIEAPGWYGHLFEHRGEDPSLLSISWLTRVARCLRDAGLDASSAHVIEAARLVEALSAISGLPLPGLNEMNDAVISVMTGGEPAPLKLIHERLIVGESLGRVPKSAPQTPMMQDLEQQCRRLRMKPEALEKTVDLDLRTDGGLARSHLLHRLSLLNIPWGMLQGSGQGRGTFHEIWTLRWQPDFAVMLVDAGCFGNTVVDAATAFVAEQAAETAQLGEVGKLLSRAVLADLDPAVHLLVTRLKEMGALTHRADELMGAVDPLAQVMRYGDVRQTKTDMVGEVLDGMVTRICVHLPIAGVDLDEDAAEAFLEKLIEVHDALKMLQKTDWLDLWFEALAQLADNPSTNGLLVGRAVRMLLDSGYIDVDETQKRMGRFVSPANDPFSAAAWLDGFLRHSGMVLLHSEPLWVLVDGWVSQLGEDVFVKLLPLIRRTFSSFPSRERGMLGQRAKGGQNRQAASALPSQINEARADQVLSLIEQIVGLEVHP